MGSQNTEVGEVVASLEGIEVVDPFQALEVASS